MNRKKLWKTVNALAFDYMMDRRTVKDVLRNAPFREKGRYRYYDVDKIALPLIRRWASWRGYNPDFYQVIK